MKKITILLAIFSVLFFIGCDGSSRGTAELTINTGLNKLTKSATPPSNVTSITVTITGSDMDTIEESFSVSDTISISVPIGTDRKILVHGEINPSDPGALLSYMGSTTVDIAAGTNTASITMGVGDTKIIIPDPSNWNGTVSRLIQLTDFTYTTWNEIIASDVSGIASSFNPWDIDFDRKGRVYIANNIFGSTGASQIIRINNFTTPSVTSMNEGSNPIEGTRYIAIDQINDFIYFAGSSTNPEVLYRKNLTDGSSDIPTTMTTTSLNLYNIIALACDLDGNIYIADYNDDPEEYKIVKASITGSTATLERTYSTYLDFSLFLSGAATGNKFFADIKIYNDYVYVANHDGADGYKIIKLDKDLNYIESYGNATTVYPSTDPGQFYGPHYFAAIRRDGIYIIDEKYESGRYDKLVKISDFSDTGWEVFDPSTITNTGSDNFFEFFYDC